MRRSGGILAWALVLSILLVPLRAPTATAAQSQDAICESAKREGQLSILTTHVFINYLEEVLGKKFPWLRVTVTGDVAAPARLITQAMAGRPEYDLLIWSLPGLLGVHERGLLTRFSEEETRAFGVPPSARLAGGAILGGWTVVHAIAYDTRRVRPEEAPRRWQDLLLPRWREKLVSEVNAISNGIAALGLMFGEAWAFDFARKLRDDVRVTLAPSIQIARQMVLTGEKDLQWTSLGDLIHLRERRGEPWGWAPISPTYAARFAITVPIRAPHPNAAKCGALWLASPEAKGALEEISYEFGDASVGSPSRIRRELDRLRVRVFVENTESARRRLELFGRLVPVLTGQVR